MNENINKKFDVKNFDYDKCYEEVKENASKNINIIVCGATGVGKSSLINDFFEFDKDRDAPVGSSGKPQTRGIHEYHSKSITLFDTEGYEVENSSTPETSAFYKNIIDLIDERKNTYSADLDMHIHEVWYCINNRFMDLDEKLIKDIQARNIPVCVIITKVDNLDENEVAQIKDAVGNAGKRNRINGVEVFTYSTNSDLGDEYVQKSEINSWAHHNLDDYLRESFIPSLKKAQGQMAEMMIKHKIPKYAVVAAGTVAATSFVPVPFSDSVPLMGIQVKMAMDILSCYGIDNDMKGVVTNLVGAGAVSYIGKTLASQLLSVIPFVGGAAKATVNVSVATTVTATLGVAITKICEEYTKACIENGGSKDLMITKISDFFTVENLKKVMKEISKGKEQKVIKEIVNALVDKFKDTKKGAKK